MPESPVKDVTFGTALEISLDNYYDLLKKQVGGLKQDEFLQLKLVADTIDISPDKKASEGGYIWWSFFNLLNRSDRAIAPTPVLGEVQTSLVSLADVYGRFLTKLRTYVTVDVLSPDDQVRVAELDLRIQDLKSDSMELYIRDRDAWKRYAEAMGYEIGDDTAYAQWVGQFGHLEQIQSNMDKISDAVTARQKLLDTQYSDPSDKEVIQAVADFENPAMRLRYPNTEDNLYSDGDKFSIDYLARLNLGSSALFDDRRAIFWDKSLATMRKGGGGSFDATFDKNTQKSTSITTDWSGSASGSYRFIRVKASASEHKSIQEDFTKATGISLKARSAYRVNLQFPAWFKPVLFSHRHVLKNPHAFREFFGPKGSMLYYVSALITVRGFETTFTSEQNWTYDYVRKFSASGGGGFNVFGISFGGKGSYSSHQTEHQVDQSTTKLSIKDDENTIRFVGYAVTKVDVFNRGVTGEIAALHALASDSLARDHSDSKPS